MHVLPLLPPLPHCLSSFNSFGNSPGMQSVLYQYVAWYVLLDEPRAGLVLGHITVAICLVCTRDEAPLAAPERLKKETSDQFWHKSSRLDRVLPAFPLNASLVDCNRFVNSSTVETNATTDN